ncbi:MAG: hypothetical protein C5B45_06630 [Chlamydiae bacterium]|nr:MAG: hypothetical protein C5B45_06630 [Chlamydiota bacterium]
MYKKLAKGAFIGGITVFIWSMLSWMVLPWHTQIYDKFTDEAEVAKVLKENTLQSGMYILPNTSHYSNNTPTKEIRKAEEILKTGPFVFASIKLDGMKKMGAATLEISLCSYILAAAIIAWMLLQTQGLRFLEKTLFVTMVGLLTAILGIIPAWNWWHFSTAYTLVTCLDLVIGWALAGLLMAKSL